MKNLLLGIILLGIAGYSGMLIYDKLTFLDSDTTDKITYSYPETITITNLQGDTLKVTLLARNKSHIELRRDDDQLFVYPIASLSKGTQEMVLRYPNTGIKNASHYLSGGNMDLSDVYVQQLESEIQKMKKLIAELERKASSTQSLTEQRSIERKIEALEAEITEIEAKIADRQ